MLWISNKISSNVVKTTVFNHARITPEKHAQKFMKPSYHCKGVNDEEAPFRAHAGVTNGATNIVSKSAIDDSLAQTQCAADQQQESPVDVPYRLFRVNPAT